MSKTLYILVAACLILWAVGYFGYNLDEFIHILIVIAVILFLFRFIKGNRRIK